MSFTKLDELGRKLEALEHAQSMLSVDEAVQMPSGGGEKRAEAMSMLAGMHHEMAVGALYRRVDRRCPQGRPERHAKNRRQ